jgi:hypothetical protein
VLDESADRVRVFTASGRYLRTFGRRGRNPGELNRPLRIDVRGEVVTVLNPSGQASSFTLNGGPIPDASLPIGGQSLTRIGENRYAALLSGGIARQNPVPTESLVLLSADRPDTVLTVPSSDILFRGPTTTSSLRTSLCKMAYFVVDAEEALWVASGVDGMLTEWRTADGTTAPGRSIQVAPAAAPLPDSVRARQLAAVPRQFNDPAGDLYIPAALSPICGLERSNDGTLWVRLGDAEGRESWRSIESETLRPTREFMAPAGVRISAFSGDNAYGIQVDEAGVTRIMVYRLE